MLRRRDVLAGGALLLGLPELGQAAETPMFDTHTHLISNDIAHYPVDTRGAKETADELLKRVQERPVLVDSLLKLWSDNGVEGGCGVQYNSSYKTDNSYLFDCADAHKDRIAPVVILDVMKPDAPQTLRTMVRQHGVAAVRTTGPADDSGNFPWFEAAAAQALWAEAGKLGVAIELMYLPRDSHQMRLPQPAGLAHIAAFAKRYPRQTIVLDHIGWAGQAAPSFGLTPEHSALATLRNVHFKLTSINFTYLAAAKADAGTFVKTVIGLYGADRVMWGSDYGNTLAAYPDMVAWAKAGTAGLSAADRRKVMHDTGKRVFGRKA